MTQEQIKKILSDYRILQLRTVEIVNLIYESRLDNEAFPFDLSKIEDADSIEYFNDEVYVSHSYNAWGGCREYEHCRFSIKYFSQSDKEILGDVCYKRDKEIERKRIQEEESKRKVTERQEEKEREQYEILKAKFENK